MNVSSVRKAFSRRILSGVAGLILITGPLMVTAAAADPYNTPNDVAAYQAIRAGAIRSADAAVRAVPRAATMPSAIS